MSDKLTVYFLRNANGGKSQMVEAIMRLRADEADRDIDERVKKLLDDM